MSECNHGVQHWREQDGGTFCKKCDSMIKKDAYGVWHRVIKRGPEGVKAETKPLMTAAVVPEIAKEGFVGVSVATQVAAEEIERTERARVAMYEADRIGPHMFEESHRRYERDAEYRTSVDMMVSLALRHGYTPYEMKQLAYSAALLIELRGLRAFKIPISEPR